MKEKIRKEKQKEKVKSLAYWLNTSYLILSNANTEYNCVYLPIISYMYLQYPRQFYNWFMVVISKTLFWYSNVIKLDVITKSKAPV